LVFGLLVTGKAWGKDDEAIPVVRFNVERFAVDGENPLSAARTRAILAPYLGAQEGLERLVGAAQALEDALRAAGRAFQRVVLVPQTLTAGVVRLRIVTIKVSKVVVHGNEHYSEDNIARMFPGLVPGEPPPPTATLSRQLRLANEQPAKSVALTFRDSETAANALEADIAVKDRRPYSVFTSLENTGTASTGPWRWTVGGSYMNLFDRDQTVSATYTTAVGHAGQVKQGSVSYSAPIYRWAGSVLAYYVASDVSTGFVESAGLDISGSGRFWGVRYTQRFGSSGGFRQRVTVGLDDKLFDNVGRTTSGTNILDDVRSRPVSVEYSATMQGSDWGGTFTLAYVRNLVAGGANNGFAYARNREGAEPGWDLVRITGAAAGGSIFGWQPRALVQVQVANEPLIPGEQFGLGGARSVRGFDEREVAGDSGFRVSGELWSPDLGPFASGRIRVLAFVDRGVAYLDRPLVVNGSRREGLASIGAGLRWTWKDYASISFDLAAVLDGSPAATVVNADGSVTTPTKRGAGDVRGHLSFGLRY